ncbi:MAG TPA: SctK family type III secretion system sorting platform protein, partial [Opitutales bacterium]|nr:SctK family type III secretion system sorting platform protein [Opitutales bacterium]
EALMECARVRGRARAWLLDSLGIAQSFDFDFQRPARRLMLVDVGFMQRLFFYVGAGLVSDRIAHLVAKTERTALQQKLGEGIYLFAVKRAPFLRNIAPKLPVLEHTTGAVFEDMLHAARQCLECCYSGEPRAFTERLRLRFPAHIPWNFDESYAPELKEQCWGYMHRILTRDIAPHTASCFE